MSENRPDLPVRFDGPEQNRRCRAGVGRATIYRYLERKGASA